MAKDVQRKVPEVRFKGFTDDWEQRKLGELFSTITDYVANGSFKSLRKNVKTYNTPNYAYMIRLVDASNNWKGPWLYTDRNGYLFLKKTSLKVNDVLLSNVGAGVGKTFLVPNLDKPMTLAPNSILLRSSLFSERYLFYLINTYENKNKILNMVGISAQPKLNKTDFKKVKVQTSPQKQEQSKIEETLSLIEKIIALQQRKLEQLKLLKKALLQNLFTENKYPKIRFKEFNEPWKQRKLGEITQRIRGNDGRMDLPLLTISARQGWLTQQKRFSSNIAGKEKKNYTLLRKNQLSYNHGNSKAAIYGTVYSLKEYQEALVPKVYHSFSLIDNNSSKFIESYFHTKKLDRQLREYISSTARMDGLLNISFNDFMKILLFLPSYNEQIRISKLMISVSKLISLQQTKLDKLQTLKKFLLQKLFI